MSSVCLIEAINDNIITAKLVVLTPPAVEPGLPPITISIIVRSIDPSDNSAILTVLNPAVLGVIDWKNDANHDSVVPMPAKEFVLSIL